MIILKALQTSRYAATHHHHLHHAPDPFTVRKQGISQLKTPGPLEAANQPANRLFIPLENLHRRDLLIGSSVTHLKVLIRGQKHTLTHTDTHLSWVKHEY